MKEARTLDSAVERLSHEQGPELSGITLFYFTDNAVTYYIFAAGSSRLPHLQGIVEKVCLHELRWGFGWSLSMSLV